MADYKQGATIAFKATIQAASPDPFGEDVNTDPDNGVKITITDSEGTALVTSASMTKSATGLYYYIYQLATDAPVGIWEVQMLADGTTYDNPECEYFRVVSC